MLRFAIATLAAGTLVGASPQDPTQTLPDNYKVELENDYVKVVRVHYDAGAKLPEHTHPGGTTAYVYLNDSDGVVFSHVGGNNRAVTRPAVKAGAIRIAAGPEEHHSAENTSSTPTDFLRIMFKTDNAGVNNLRQRLAPTDVEFANKQMRITRLRVKPGTASRDRNQESAQATRRDPRALNSGRRPAGFPSDGLIRARQKISRSPEISWWILSRRVLTKSNDVVHDANHRGHRGHRGFFRNACALLRHWRLSE